MLFFLLTLEIHSTMINSNFDLTHIQFLCPNYDQGCCRSETRCSCYLIYRLFYYHQWLTLLLLFFLKVVAITVFLLLSVAYYAFFAPFLGKDLYEYVAIGVYSIFVSNFSVPVFPWFLWNSYYSHIVFFSWCVNFVPGFSGIFSLCSMYSHWPCWSRDSGRGWQGFSL